MKQLWLPENRKYKDLREAGLNVEGHRVAIMNHLLNIASRATGLGPKELTAVDDSAEAENFDQQFDVISSDNPDQSLGLMGASENTRIVGSVMYRPNYSIPQHWINIYLWNHGDRNPKASLAVMSVIKPIIREGDAIQNTEALYSASLLGYVGTRQHITTLRSMISELDRVASSASA